MRVIAESGKMPCALCMTAALFVGCVLSSDASAASLRSPDRAYTANQVRNKMGVHYQVRNVKGRSVVLTTRAQFPSWNTVKAGKYDRASTKFAAAYHYSHDGAYTWVGVWSLSDAEFIGAVRLDGQWTVRIPDSVFEDVER